MVQYDGRSLVPDLTSSFNVAMKIAQQNSNQKKEDMERAAYSQAQISLQGKSVNDIVSDPQSMMAISKMNRINQGSGDNWLKMISTADAAKSQELTSIMGRVNNVSKASLHLIRNGDHDGAKTMIKRTIIENRDSGLPTEQLESLLGLSPDRMALSLQAQLISSGEALKVADKKFSNIMVNDQGQTTGVASDTNQVELIPNNSGVDRSKPKEPKATKERRTAKDAAGFLRYVDSGKRVFEGVKKPEDQEKVFNKAKSLRAEFKSETNEFIDVNNAFTRIKESAKDPSAAGDLALIFNYMKMLDPASVVRESEFAMAASAGNLGDRFVSVGKKLVDGERLAPSIRADFIKRANKLFKGAAKDNKKREVEFTRLARKSGVDPELVVVERDLSIGEPEVAGSITISTQEQRDALPSGSFYIDSQDGKKYRKL